MPCTKPLLAYRAPDGALFFQKNKHHNERQLLIPCGRCQGCNLERSRQWALRCIHEGKLHGTNNSYITLTYDDEHLPPNNNLHHRDFVLFLKRLRKQLRHKIKFYMCGEYGDKNGRPHYHAIIFGHRYTDLQYHSTNHNGDRLSTSATLQRQWGLGHCLIGELSYQSASYIARYIMKKVRGDAAETHYTHVNLETGEIFQRTPEYNQMSRGGRTGKGIAHDWYQRYRTDVFPSDQCIIDGKPVKPPRYYDKLLRKGDRLTYDELKAKREYAGAQAAADNTPERLEVKAAVTAARIKSLKRPL